MSKGVLTVVSGFSGAGKGTVMKRLLEKYENYALSISVTTRNSSVLCRRYAFSGEKRNP